jgi:hypothetical protein
LDTYIEKKAELSISAIFENERRNQIQEDGA